MRVPDLVRAAQRCRARLVDDDAWRPREVARLSDLTLAVDARYCRQVADRFAGRTCEAGDPATVRGYQRLKDDCLVQYEEIRAAGVEVAPWFGPGQPYRESAELVRGVRESGTIHLFLTRDGHGPPGASGPHPLRESSGVTAGGVELAYNDLLRVVHDVFGHVMLGNGFDPGGELKAAYCHMTLLAEEARPVLFAEQVAQTCWFFFGPHAHDADGRLLEPGDPGYVPPRRRPYPEQKAFAADPVELEAFQHMFRLPG